jgi:hypothetical protein
MKRPHRPGTLPRPPRTGATSAPGPTRIYKACHTSNMRAPTRVCPLTARVCLVVCFAPQVVPWGEKESLAMLQRQLDVDVLITGHTHKCKVPPQAPPLGT